MRYSLVAVIYFELSSIEWLGILETFDIKLLRRKIRFVVFNILNTDQIHMSKTSIRRTPLGQISSQAAAVNDA